MPRMPIRVRVDVENPGLERDLVEIVESIEGFHIQSPDDKDRPNLLILELGEMPDEKFRLAEALVQSKEVDELFLTAANPDQSILLKAMRTGVKEFFIQPIDREEVRGALEGARERVEAIQKTPVRVGQIIDVIGSKGGVGTTTIAVNLAVGMAEEMSDLSVALVDMNMIFGEVPLFLDLKPHYHWGEITKNIYRLDDTFLMNILSKHPSGVYVLSSPGMLESHDATTPEIMEHLLNLMRTMFDVLVIDGGQTLDETALKILELSDSVLLVSILSLPCLTNTNNLLKTFRDLGYPSDNRIKVVINRYLKNSEISLQDAEKALEGEIYWTIPNDYPSTMSAINQGKPLTQSATKSPIVKNITELSGQLLHREKDLKKKKWKIFNRD